MNGQALTPDHGAPVRLAVPGWYGCAWIKWVDEIRWVAGDEPATSQMQEFAGRTHQNGVPVLARDYEAPAIDTAAMPIRVEQRRVDGRLEYRVVGIVLGRNRHRRSSGDPLRHTGSRNARPCLPTAVDAPHLGALDPPLAAGRTRVLRHQPSRQRTRRSGTVVSTCRSTFDG